MYTYDKYVMQKTVSALLGHFPAEHQTSKVNSADGAARQRTSAPTGAAAQVRRLPKWGPMVF